MIFHLTTLDKWEQAVLDGDYRPESLIAEGFIHLSTEAQVQTTANLYYSGKTLLLLAVDPAQLTAELRFEAPAGSGKRDDLFPHLYGPLNLDAVTKTQTLVPGSDGRFEISPLETESP